MGKKFKIALFLASAAVAFAAFAIAQTTGTSGYRVIKTVPLAGDGGWDYLTVDAKARRIYISRSSKVAILDADSFALVGEIADTAGVHGIALAPEFGRGFTSNGRAGTVTIFDLKSFAVLGSAPTGKNPDAIAYDGNSGRVYTFNGGSDDATAINAKDGSIAGTIALGGRPEFAVADGRGEIFVNIESTSELVEIDARALTVVQRWPLKPCEDPSGLSMDRVNRRLFVACGNKMMAVVNADTGKVIATPATGDGTDASAFDPGTGLAFASNGEGTLTVIQQNDRDHYSLLENVITKKSARTMGLDLETHRIVLPAAELNPPAEGQRWPTVKPGTVVLVVLGK